MRRVIRILAAVLFLVPAAVLLAADAQAEKDAEAAARAWLAGVDAGKYGASWEAASSEFRKSMTKTQWEDALAKVRAPLAAVLSRKLTSATFTKTLPGAPEGAYVVIQYETDFSGHPGGKMIETVTRDSVTYAKPPHRFEAGTPPILEAIGLGAAVEWLARQDRQAIAAHEHGLYARVREGLAGANWLKVLGEAPGKGAILSFTVDGAHAHDVAQILDKYGVAVRAGTHCAEPLMRRFGLTSSARASFALYNTHEEADSFVDALTKTQAFFA